MTATSFERAAQRMAQRARTGLAADLERLLSDAGLTRAELARAAQVDSSHLTRILAATADPTPATWARLATALGADLAMRLYPNTGPAIRDRHQARILEAILANRHPRWHAYPEIAVRQPSRGWIDLGLHDPRTGTLVAVEIQSDLRRLEQLLRWAAEKAASLVSWEGWVHLGEPSSVSQLLVVRETRATRDVAREFARSLRTAYPAHPADALEALTGQAAWPGASLLWAAPARERGRLPRLVARP